MFTMFGHSHFAGTVPYSPYFGSPPSCTVPYPMAAFFPSAPFSTPSIAHCNDPILCKSASHFDLLMMSVHVLSLLFSMSFPVSPLSQTMLSLLVTVY